MCEHIAIDKQVIQPHLCQYTRLMSQTQSCMYGVFCWYSRSSTSPSSHNSPAVPHHTTHPQSLITQLTRSPSPHNSPAVPHHTTHPQSLITKLTHTPSSHAQLTHSPSSHNSLMSRIANKCPMVQWESQIVLMFLGHSPLSDKCPSHPTVPPWEK